MNIKYNPDYQPKEVYNFEEFQDFMDSKVVRNPRSHTPVDFITEEQLREINAQGIKDLTSYVPTPKNVREHMNFVSKVSRELRKAGYIDHPYLLEIHEEDNLYIYFSYDWYKKFGIEKD